MLKKVTYILFGIDKAPAFEWIIDKIDRQRFHLEFLLISNKKDTHIENHCVKNNIPFYRIPYTSKKDIPVSILRTYRILRNNHTDIVHVHIFGGGIIGIPAAFLARVPKRVYTRHYATFHHQFYPKGVKYDKLINKLSTHIIAICNNVKEVLMNLEQVPENKITLIRHGFDLNDFYTVSQERLDVVQQRYNVRNQSPVIGIVSRYMYLKGIQYTIAAYKNILRQYPNALLVLANANGEYKKEIQSLLSELPQNSYIEIPFENDNAALFKLFDVFVHVPINKNIEAFGQIYVEALAADIPSVFTLSGVAPEFITDKENALVVDFENAAQIENAVLEILQNNELKSRLKQNARMNLEEFFSIDLMIDKLEALYDQ